jgi:hypothetical protein
MRRMPEKACGDAHLPASAHGQQEPERHQDDEQA